MEVCGYPESLPALLPVTCRAAWSLSSATVSLSPVTLASHEACVMPALPVRRVSCPLVTEAGFAPRWHWALCPISAVMGKLWFVSPRVNVPIISACRRICPASSASRMSWGNSSYFWCTPAPNLPQLMAPKSRRWWSSPHFLHTVPVSAPQPCG